MLYLDEVAFTIKEKIINKLKDFPFWPNSTTKLNELNDIVFWSENHIFMLLSSAYLLHQFTSPSEISTRISYSEIKLLKIYLQAHVKFDGIYEVLSHCYAPYTLSALFNLYDYAADIEIKSLAENLINRIIYIHILTTLKSNGTTNLTASCRTFHRFKFSNHGHNINQLIHLFTGICVDPLHSTAISDFILTTTWLPNMNQIESALNFNGFVHFDVNHDISSIHDYYEDVPPEDRIPFYWSAGLVTHPQFIEHTYTFQRKHNLQRNSYNEMFAGFEQQPWMANIDGVGIWTQSGGRSSSLIGFDIANTHMPHICQRGHILVAAYNSVHLYWPSSSSTVFDETVGCTSVEAGAWWVGRR
eukprot:gene8223-16907_t